MMWGAAQAAHTSSLIVQNNSTLKVRFSATLGEEPEIEVGWSSGYSRSTSRRLNGLSVIVRGAPGVHHDPEGRSGGSP